LIYRFTIFYTRKKKKKKKKKKREGSVHLGIVLAVVAEYKEIDPAGGAGSA
jgi:hypothetical protein